MMRKKVVVTVFVWLFCHTVFAQEKTVTVSIRNASAIPALNKVVAIPWPSIKAKWPLADTATIVVTASSGKQVPLQWESCGTGAIQNLLVQVTVPAKTTIRLQIKGGAKETVQPKVYGRLVPERYDDFAWENDRIAYRMYGKALEATTFNALGIDVWAKRTEKLVVDKWYKSEDYHTDHGEGLDFYGVGYTLGAGNNAPFVNDSLYHAKNFTRAEVLDSGPLRLTFRLHYEPWLVNGKVVQKEMTITLDAGEQLNRVETRYSRAEAPLPIAAGVNIKTGNDVQWLNKKEGIIGYWLPRDSVNGTIGVGLLFTKPVALKKGKGHLMGVTTLGRNEPLVYYAGGVWDKAGLVTTSNEWFAYLKKYKQQWLHPLQVILN